MLFKNLWIILSRPHENWWVTCCLIDHVLKPISFRYKSISISLCALAGWSCTHCWVSSCHWICTWARLSIKKFFHIEFSIKPLGRSAEWFIAFICGLELTGLTHKGRELPSVLIGHIILSFWSIWGSVEYSIGRFWRWNTSLLIDKDSLIFARYGRHTWNSSHELCHLRSLIWFCRVVRYGPPRHI